MKKTLQFLTVALMLCSFAVVKAQTKYYGGSSYAYVKDDKGTQKIVYWIVDCIYRDEAEAKQALKPPQIGLYWKLDSPIYYDINVSAAEGTWFGATASAKVRDKQGNERYVTGETQCIYRSIPKAKEAAVPIKASSEDFITPIKFSISSCDH